MNVTIVTPDRATFHGTAASVTLPGWEGEMDVRPGHTRLVVLLRPGLAVVGDQRFVVGSGLAEVAPDQVTVLVDAAETAGTYDKATAQKDLAKAEDAVTHSADGTEARRAAEAARDLANARLS